MKQAKFSIGQCIYHRLFDYRGVIIDVDPEFLGEDEWYEQVARSRPPRNEPWYHVLVHDADSRTYVAEQNLIEDDTCEPVDNPMLERYFVEYDGNSYSTGRHVN